MTKLVSGLSKGQGDGLAAVARLALRLEPVAPEDVSEVEKLYVRAIEAREGRQMLPFDLQVKLEEAFGKDYRIDPATGEIIVPDLEPPMPGDDTDDTAAAGADGGED